MEKNVKRQKKIGQSLIQFDGDSNRHACGKSGSYQGSRHARRKLATVSVTAAGSVGKNHWSLLDERVRACGS